MPSTTDADIVRHLYQAIADADFAAAERCFAPDAVWHVLGTSPIAGDHHGWSQIRDNLLAKLGPLSGGTFRADLVDVAVGSRFLVAVEHATASSGGKTLDITACQLMRVDGGLLQGVRSHYYEQDAFDAFWR